MRSRLILGALAALAIVGVVAIAGTGNGAPSGFHENINIIGVNNPKNDNFTGGNGSTIFVDRTASTKFYVQGGSSFQIVDHNGTDGYVGSPGATGKPGGAGYQPGLIFPYNASATPTWRVEIWVRMQGPQGSSSQWTTSYFDGTNWVQWDTFTLTKDAPSKFVEKTSSLLADGYKDMLWQLDPVTKFRICQMRVYLLDGK